MADIRPYRLSRIVREDLCCIELYQHPATGVITTVTYPSHPMEPRADPMMDRGGENIEIESVRLYPGPEAGMPTIVRRKDLVSLIQYRERPEYVLAHIERQWHYMSDGMNGRY